MWSSPPKGCKKREDGVKTSATLFPPSIGIDGQRVEEWRDVLQYPSAPYYFPVEAVRDVAREASLIPAREVFM